MAYASITYTSASGTTFALTNSEGNPIQYLRQADIAVTVNGVLQTLTTNYTFNTAGTAIVLNSAVTNATVVINRTTSITDATVSFTAGSTLTAQDLNNSDKQNRFALQEFSDTYGALTTGSGDLSALAGFIGSAETWLSDNAHAPTTGAVDSRVDSKIDTALTTDVVAGDSITVTDNSPSSGQITIGVTNASISTAKLVDSSVTTAKIADGNVTTAKILDSNVTTAKIADSNVTTAKIADSAVTSAKIADGTIVASDLASDAVTTAKILDANVTTGKIADGAVTTGKLADSSVTSAKIADGTIVAGDLASDSVTTAKILDANVTTAKIADSNVTTGKIADSAVTAVKIADGVITSAKLNASTVVTNAEQSASTPDDTSFFTTSASDARYDARYVNVTGDTMSGALAMGSNKITGLGTPTANADAATKLYVDNSVAAGVGDADYGDITVSGTGTVWTIDSGVVTSAKIADNTIVNADINASAAIAGTKISPDFGSQNTTTTGTSTAASFIPTSSTAPTNGVYLPSANNVAISTNGTGRLFVDASGNVGVGVASPAPGGQGIHSHNSSAADSSLRLTNSATGATNGDGFAIQVASDGTAKLRQFENLAITFETNGTERMRLTSAGLLGLGSSSPGQLLHLRNASNPAIQIDDTTNSQFIASITSAGSFGNNSTVGQLYLRGAAGIGFSGDNGTSTGMVFTSGNRLGIGSTAPVRRLHIAVAGSDPQLRLQDTSASESIWSAIEFIGDSSRQAFIGKAGSTDLLIINDNASGALRFSTNATERARIDSSGRLLVGTSSSRSGWFNSSSWGNPTLQVEGTSVFNSGISVTNNSNDDNGPQIILGKSRATSVGGVTVVSSGDNLGRISFQGADGTELVAGATIEAAVDGSPGANDLPSRLVFSTTADGASSPTERFYLYSNGYVRAPGVYNLTTATAADVRVDTQGYLYRSTSSIRYKKDVETLQDEYADAILNARPVWFRSLSEKDNPDWGYWGFIAEEVEQIDPRLCTYGEDEEGNQRVESVQYDRFVPHLLNLIKRQKEQIQAMEARLSALEAS